ncbi:MAG: amidoligase family protein [Lamprobacter sp.]|uniref:amidoligase family protein n=1 Tax=Lamprobacter sp. TaxID=3100796 RepID=UPI002B25CBB2|nr:amidoligase family protein [Lamprobacter sp.]MEA3639269.1 amidoligase family protein [Lamprobacter sp.]
MLTTTNKLAMPPLITTSAGQERRVGVEIELSGLSISETADLVQETLFGADAAEVLHPGRYEIALRGDPAGDWEIELDFAYLKALGRRERNEDDLGAAVEGFAEDLLRLIAERIVPVEVISPPLPLSRLAEFNLIIERLRAAGASGTAGDPTYAFGMQLNPEMPATDVDSIRQYLQAFLCIEDWLRERAAVDLTRRLTFFADPFPKGYVRTAVAPSYSPNRAQLIDDYLAANPTRNRALDMLPLFAHLDEARVRERVQDERIKSRPTLHYRLPNSEVDRPGWDLSGPWQDWLVVERLAADPARLERLCATYSDYLNNPLGRLTGDWRQECQQWLSKNALL